MERADPTVAEVRRIRVLAADLPGMVTEVVANLIAQQPDMVFLGQTQGHLELLSTVDAQTDVLVLGARQGFPPPGICSHLLGEFPFLRILVLANTGEETALYWLGLRWRRQDAPAPAALVAFVREAFALNPTVVLGETG